MKKIFKKNFCGQLKWVRTTDPSTGLWFESISHQKFFPALFHHSLNPWLAFHYSSSFWFQIYNFTSGVVEAVPSSIFLIFGVIFAVREPSVCTLHKATSNCSARFVTSDNFSEMASTEVKWLSSGDLRKKKMQRRVNVLHAIFLKRYEQWL